MFRKNGFLLILSGLLLLIAWYGTKQFEKGSGNQHLVNQLKEHFDECTKQLLNFKSLGYKKLQNDPSLSMGSASWPFSISVYEGDSLQWWSNTNYLFPMKHDGIHKMGVYYLWQKTWNEGNEKWCLNIPFLIKELRQSNYQLYPDGPLIPTKIKLSEQESPYLLPGLPDISPWYLHFDHSYRPTSWLIFVFLAYLFSFGFGIAFFAIILDNIVSRFEYKQLAPVLLFVLLLLFRFIWHSLHLSPLMEECIMHSYSGKFLSTDGKLADQIINLILLFGLLLYTFKRLQDFRFNHLPAGWKFFLAGINYFGTLTALILFTRTLKDLVEYADFDANLVYNPTIRSFVLLFSLGLLLCLFFLISHRMAYVISQLKLSLTGKLVSMGLAFALIFPFYSDLSIGFPIFLMYLASFSYLILFDLFVEVKKPSIAWLLAWLILFSGFTSILLQRFAAMNLTKETKILAEELVSGQDPVLKNLISEHYQPLFMQMSIDEEFSSAQLLDDIFNSDEYISSFYEWQLSNVSEKVTSDPIKVQLFRDTASFDFNDGSNVKVNFLPKSKMVNHMAHSHQKLPYKGLRGLDNLSYGYYYKDSLKWQLGSPKFDPYLKKLTIPDYDWFSVQGSQYLSIPQLKGGVIVAAKEEASLGYKISFFSLLFFVLVISLVILSILNSIVAFLPDQMYLRFVKVTSLQNKLQYAFIGVLVFSFICIGVTSVYYFKQEYLKDNMLRLVEYVDTWRKSNSKSNPGIHLSPISSKRISPSTYFMTSTFEKSNINWPFPLFINTLPNFPGLPYSIYANNNSHNLQQIYPQVKDDQILSTYIASPNEDSWIGVYYSLEAPQSIRSFIGNLFNISVFILIISVAIAIFVSRTLTAPIVRLGQRMQSTKLGRKNEPLVWNQRDELGVLINQYNNMVESLEKSAEMIAQSEREIAWREMAKQVAHEIKNPLTPMKLSIQHLESKISGLDPEEVPQFVRRVSTTLIEQIDNLTRIATEFSSFSKLPEPNNEKIVLNDLVSSVHDLFRKREDIIFNLYVPIDEIYIFADRSHVLRILNNLIKNAIQAIPEEKRGKMDIKLFTRKGYAIIQVSDNGLGIPPSMRDKVFFPNFTTKSSGTGLGLAICKDIVESYGGRIYFESVENVGSDFFVEFPLFEVE